MRKIKKKVILGVFGFILVMIVTLNLKNEQNIEATGGELMYIKINDVTLEASLNDNSSAKELIKRLEKQDITIDMHDYGNFEIVGKLGFELPTNDENITTSAGDIILYLGSNISIYYDKNTWNFTRLGKIMDTSSEDLKKILGDGNVVVTFSLRK